MGRPEIGLKYLTYSEGIVQKHQTPNLHQHAGSTAASLRVRPFAGDLLHAELARLF